MHFFDSQGQPAMVQQGYASLRAEYDDQGNRTGTAYFDVAARAVTPKDADAKEAVA
jgi:hypothetical protein